MQIVFMTIDFKRHSTLSVKCFYGVSFWVFYLVVSGQMAIPVNAKTDPAIIDSSSIAPRAGPSEAALRLSKATEIRGESKLSQQILPFAFDTIGGGQSTSNRFFPLNHVFSHLSYENSTDSSSYKYIGNSSSNKFHRPWCPFEQVMRARRAVFFHSRKEAISAQFSPCHYCLPPIVMRVKCVLLKSNKISAP